MDTAVLNNLASQIESLPPDEQLWLLRRIARSLRRPATTSKGAWDQSLVAMSGDPDIQREIREIAEEFLATETDGLEG
jgi:hypothetical protein